MKKLAYITFLLMGLVWVNGLRAQVPVMDFDSLEPYLHRDNDTTYVVNFWATWCKPCVKELPAFEKLHETTAGQKVKVLLVSLDFMKYYHSKLIPFIQKHNLQPEVILLNDPHSNVWIDKVSPQWSGAIPATLIYRGNRRNFYERSFSYDQLETELQTFMKKQ